MSRLPKDHRFEARRPGLTPLFLAGIMFWLGAATAYGEARLLQPRALMGLGAVASAACVLLAGVGFKRRASLAFACAFLAAGCAFGLVGGWEVESAAAQAAQMQDGSFSLALAEDSSNSGFGESAVATVKAQGGSRFKATVRFEEGGPYFYGQRFSCHGSFEAADFKADAFAWSKGVCGTIGATSMREEPLAFPGSAFLQVREAAIQALGSSTEDSAVLAAIACGYRHDVRGTDTYRAYQTCGLAHMIAVSGAHLVIVTSLMAALLRKARCPRRLSVALLVGLMASYLVFSAVPVSAVRATVMSSVGILALLGKRRPSSLNALGISLIGMIAFDPPSSVSVSLSLSALSTAGIVLFAPLFQGWFARFAHTPVAFAFDALSLTLASCLLSQLYACSVFSLLPLASPVANALCAPLFAPLCALGLLAGLAGAFSLPGAEALRILAEALASFTDGLVRCLAALPLSSIPFTCSATIAFLATFAAAALLWACWPRPSKAIVPACCLLVLLALAWFAPRGGDRIVMLDVGQGDAFLVQSQGRSLLIDTGNHDTQLLQGLARAHLASLDAVVITHGDDDHCGSLDALGSATEVRQAIVAAETLGSAEEHPSELRRELEACTDEVRGVVPGDAFALGRFTFTVLWPESFHEGGGNGDSLCLWMAYDGNADGAADATALFTGDAEKEQLAEMIDRYGLGDVDILKVGHHGSKNAFEAEQLEALHPAIALMGVGEGNRYGHPHQSILDMLAEEGSRVYRTDADGEVVLSFSPQGIAVGKVK